jgi:hypothetical protein
MMVLSPNATLRQQYSASLMTGSIRIRATSVCGNIEVAYTRSDTGSQPWRYDAEEEIECSQSLFEVGLLPAVACLKAKPCPTRAICRNQPERQMLKQAQDIDRLLGQAARIIYDQ